MSQFLPIFQALSSVLLIILVLLQVRGTGFGRSSNSSSFTRRGIERLVFRATFVTAALFLLLSGISLFI